jgi:hypothetical protein
MHSTRSQGRRTCGRGCGVGGVKGGGGGGGSADVVKVPQAGGGGRRGCKIDVRGWLPRPPQGGGGGAGDCGCPQLRRYKRPDCAALGNLPSQAALLVRCCWCTPCDQRRRINNQLPPPPPPRVNAPATPTSPTRHNSRRCPRRGDGPMASLPQCNGPSRGCADPPPTWWPAQHGQEWSGACPACSRPAPPPPRAPPPPPPPPPARRQHATNPPTHVQHGDAGTSPQQRSHRRLPGLRDRPSQRRGPIFVGQIEVRTRLQQGDNGTLARGGGRVHERRRAAAVGSIGQRPRRNQHADGVRMPHPRRLHQRRVWEGAHVVIGVGATLQGRTDGRQVTLPCGGAQLLRQCRHGKLKWVRTGGGGGAE